MLTSGYLSQTKSSLQASFGKLSGLSPEKCKCPHKGLFNDYITLNLGF